jgi:hypothetical protein
MQQKMRVMKCSIIVSVSMDLRWSEKVWRWGGRCAWSVYYAKPSTKCRVLIYSCGWISGYCRSNFLYPNSPIPNQSKPICSTRWPVTHYKPYKQTSDFFSEFFWVRIGLDFLSNPKYEYEYFSIYLISYPT